MTNDSAVVGGARSLSDGLDRDDVRERDLHSSGSVAGDTSLLSKGRGWISVARLSERILPGELVLGMDERGRQSWVPLRDVWYVGKKAVHTVRARSGLSVGVTQYQQVLTERGWVARNRLHAGADYLIAAREARFEGADPISSDLAFLVAGVMAEGYTPRGKASATFVNHESEMMTQFVAAYEREFGQTPSTGVSGTVAYVRAMHAARMHEWGMPRALSEGKFLPDVMMSMTLESTRRFLSFLLACEGGPCRGGHFEFSSKSQRMIGQVQLLLLRFGIYGWVAARQIKGYGTHYKLHVNDRADQRRLYDELAVCWPERKRSLLRELLERKAADNFSSHLVPVALTSRLVDQYPLAASYAGGGEYRRCLTRRKFAALAGRTGDPVWTDLSDGLHRYDLLRTIERRGREVPVYGIRVGGGSPYVIANGLVIRA